MRYGPGELCRFSVVQFRFSTLELERRAMVFWPYKVWLASCPLKIVKQHAQRPKYQSQANFLTGFEFWLCNFRAW